MYKIVDLSKYAMNYLNKMRSRISHILEILYKILGFILE